MNFLFWTVLIAVGMGAGLHYAVASRRSHRVSAIDSPVDSFSFTQRPEWPLDDSGWNLDDIQFLASSDRIRAVVTVDIHQSAPERRQRALQILAREIYRHTEVEAVFVEAGLDDGGRDLYLFAADGRGWWGESFVSELSASKKPRRR